MQQILGRLGAVCDVQAGVLWPAQRLRAEVLGRAAALQRLCGGAPPRCILAHADTPAFFADLLAVWCVGGSAACINPALTAGELGNLLAFTGARAVLVDSAATWPAGLVPPTGVMVLDLGREARHASADSFQPAHCQAGAEALVLFTSGTTGAPKGVVHSHAALQARIALNQAAIGAEALARTLCLLPTHFGHGLIGNCLTPLLSGGSLFLMPRAGLAGARQLAEVVQQHGIGFMSSVPAFWRLALRLSAAPAPGVLRRVHIGSAPLSARLWHEVMDWCGTAEVANLYGTTETANWIGGMLASEQPPEDGLVGRAWGGRIAVLDDAGHRRASGEGEVLVQTPSVMQGYLHRPDLTAEVLRDGWYHTGDHGLLDPRGVLRLTGRVRSMINRGGFKVYPEELDLLFERHPQVAEACAFGVPDLAAGESVRVAVRLRDAAQACPPASPQALLAWARDHIRADALPDRIHLLDDIPKTARGKPDRPAVARACIAAAGAHTATGGH